MNRRKLVWLIAGASMLPVSTQVPNAGPEGLAGRQLASASFASRGIVEFGTLNYSDIVETTTGVDSPGLDGAHWQERVPRSTHKAGLLARSAHEQQTPLVDRVWLNQISRYRFIGEHGWDDATHSVAFPFGIDCEGHGSMLIGAPRFRTYFSDGVGAAYIVSIADAKGADAADGYADGVINLGNVAAQPRSFKLVNDSILRLFGRSVASGGDVNGDGCSDLLIEAHKHTGWRDRAAVVVSVADLPAADAADGVADGVVEVSKIADQPGSWELSVEDNYQRWANVAFIGDVDSDGYSDLLIGLGTGREPYRGEVYLLSGVALASADAEDGVVDSRISLGSVAVQPGSWKFVLDEHDENVRNDRYVTDAIAANLDGDERSDIVIAAPFANDGRGALYLIAAADLSAMDDADGSSDGVIDLAQSPAGNASWKILGNDENKPLAHRWGDGGIAAGDVDGDGLDEVQATCRRRSGACALSISVSDLAIADEADGMRDRIVQLDHVLTQDDSFKLVWTTGHPGPTNVHSHFDFDADGLDDILVGYMDFQDGAACVPDGGGYRANGVVALVPGGTLHAADLEDGLADSIIDLGTMSTGNGAWKFIGGPTDRLGSSVRAGDIDGDGRVDLMLSALIPHWPFGRCGSKARPGFAQFISGVDFEAADTADGTADGVVHLDSLGTVIDHARDVDRGPPTVREIAQFENVVIMRISGSLLADTLDFSDLARSFRERYDDEFDYLIFVSNLPRFYDQRHEYTGVHWSVGNSVQGIGRRTFGSDGKLKALLHFVHPEDPIRRGPMLHEILHSWANYAVPSVDFYHWGFSSANGQLGGFDHANLVDHGDGRYSAGSFGLFANGGNSIPYSPIELYLAGFMPPDDVPDLWVANDGRWTADRDESGHSIFAATEVETWSVERIVEEHGARVPNWENSQKNFRAAAVLITDDWFPASEKVLSTLVESLSAFSKAGDDDDALFNFWEATGGRGTFETDIARPAGLRVFNVRSPVTMGRLGPLSIEVDAAPVNVNVNGAFRDPDGDTLTYEAKSSAPSVATVTVNNSTVTVTPVSVGAATVRVSATDRFGSNTTATQPFQVTVVPANRRPEPTGQLRVAIQVDGGPVQFSLLNAFRDPDGDVLLFSATTSDSSVATVAVAGASMIVTPESVGTANLNIAAADPEGSNTTVTQVIAVTVLANSDVPLQEARTVHGVLLFAAADNESGHQGFVRVINHSGTSGVVEVEAIDDTGASFGPVSLPIAAHHAVHFNSNDLEWGNAEKGMAGVGPGSGDWRLRIRSNLDIEMLAYNRTDDGLLTAMHDTVPYGAMRMPGSWADDGHYVPIFNPPRNVRQVSQLRLVNPEEVAREVGLLAVRDEGGSGRVSPPVVTVPAGAARTATSQELWGRLRDSFFQGKMWLHVDVGERWGVMNLLATPTGHLANLSSTPGAAVQAQVPLFASVDNPSGHQGFVRIRTHGSAFRPVTIEAVDDTGVSFGPVTLESANFAVHFNSLDLEGGNAEKGLSGGIGSGTGDWRLRLTSDSEIEVLAYNRTADGLLTTLHDVVPYRTVFLPDSNQESEGYYVATFNPASNTGQSSRLRLVNAGQGPAAVAIHGVDDAGESPGTMVQLVVPAGAARTVTARDLERGADGLGGTLGDGRGKWRLLVMSDELLQVLHLLKTPTGHLVNLSTAPERTEASE